MILLFQGWGFCLITSEEIRDSSSIDTTIKTLGLMGRTVHLLLSQSSAGYKGIKFGINGEFFPLD